MDRADLCTLPPHCFLIMTVYFLQKLNPPVLPVLHELIAAQEETQQTKTTATTTKSSSSKSNRRKLLKRSDLTTVGHCSLDLSAKKSSSSSSNNLDQDSIHNFKFFSDN